MKREVLEQRCRDLLRLDDNEPLNSQSLIGVFQRFRQQPSVFADLFGHSPSGEQLSERIADVFAACGQGRRAGGGQDAYFIVRDTSPSDPDYIQHQAVLWLQRLYELASNSNRDLKSPLPFDPPQVRVLEGTPPKQLKADEELIPLLRWLKRDAGQLTEGLAGNCVINELFREACYFIACDAMLRDYVLWPTYQAVSPAEDPYSSYFELWRRGVKWRVFQEDRVDIYLPRT